MNHRAWKDIQIGFESSSSSTADMTDGFRFELALIGVRVERAQTVAWTGSAHAHGFELIDLSAVAVCLRGISTENSGQHRHSCGRKCSRHCQSDVTKG